MREELFKIKGRRHAFKGVFVRFGTKNGYKGPETTVLLKDIVDLSSSKVVADHVWFTMGKRLASLSLKKDDIVRFEARVTEYLKGYRGRRDEDLEPLEYDCRLSFPTKMVKVQASVLSNQLMLPEE